MAQFYLLAIDQGTTGSRAILYDKLGRPKASAYQEFKQYYPRPGWVEHDAVEILASVRAVIRKAIQHANINSKQIASIGITNQRETVVLWDRRSGTPLSKAIVWQDRRTASICERLKKRKLESFVQKKTGLLLDPYFSGTKLSWLFAHHPRFKQCAVKGEVCFGTIDSWLLFHLSGKRSHSTDFTNASRTLLFDIGKKKWDHDLLRIFHVPQSVLPEARPSNSIFGEVHDFSPLKEGTPIRALIGDQQSALYGQGCYAAGDSKNTYGTGCFLLLNLGARLAYSRAGLLTTLACDAKGNPTYALEGSIFIAGAAIQWLRDGLKIIQKASETERIAKRAPDTGDLIVIPAFTGLGAPYWRSDVRGAIFGITRGTTREMLVKATLESIAVQVKEDFDLMKEESGVKSRILRVDGGASQNNYLMQFQADVLGLPVWRANLSESTAWGAAKLAGLSSGFWSDPHQLDETLRYKRFLPKMTQTDRKLLLCRWRDTIRHLIA
ncbi:MAG: glycerol kinase GlpK [Candidatus Omnitrophica bacterium]|nr:glycerol kinase GlpK [Candidatus Omnitrophota bacterium]